MFHPCIKNVLFEKSLNSSTAEISERKWLIFVVFWISLKASEMNNNSHYWKGIFVTASVLFTRVRYPVIFSMRVRLIQYLPATSCARYPFRFSAFVISPRQAFVPAYTRAPFPRFVIRRCICATSNIWHRNHPFIRPLRPSRSLSDLIFPRELSINIPATLPLSYIRKQKRVMKYPDCNYCPVRRAIVRFFFYSDESIFGTSLCDCWLLIFKRLSYLLFSFEIT